MKEFPYSVETQKLIKLRRKRRSELKIAVGDHYTSLRTEINYLQKEIKQSMMRSEDKKEQRSWQVHVIKVAKASGKQ